MVITHYLHNFLSHCLLFIHLNVYPLIYVACSIPVGLLLLDVLFITLLLILLLFIIFINTLPFIIYYYLLLFIV